MSESTKPNPDLTDVADQVMAEDAEVVSRTADLPAFSTYNVVAAFEGLEEGRDALVALERAGIDGSKLAFLALDAASHPPAPEQSAEQPEAGHDDEEMSGQVAKNAFAGMAVGAPVGALALAGAAALIPGVGPILGAGVLGAAAGGGALGAWLGGLWGGYSKLPVSSAWEETFTEVRDGRAMVGVHTTDASEAAAAYEVLRDAGAVRLRSFDGEGRPAPGPGGGSAASSAST
ncbi:MAG: hypothetical protein ACKVWR_21540 [Acidimicrobiales bacterium]